MVKIDFCDMWNGVSFTKDDNIFVDILKKAGIDFIISDKPDFLFFSCYGTKHLRYTNCVKIFFAAEAVTPDFNVCDYAIGFDPIVFSNRYCRRPVWLFNELPIELNDEVAINRKFCNFVYSNESLGTAVEFRKRFAKRLMEYKHVDCPGRVLNNMQNAIVPRNGDWRRGKWEFIKKYKFTIAFENCEFGGYTTEKLIDPLSMKSIPIYWGNPDVADEFDTSAFVYCNGMEENLDKIIEKIVELDQNEEKYLEMLHKDAITTDVIQRQKKDMEQFILRIIRKGNKQFEKDPLLFYKRMTYPQVSKRQLICDLLRK